MKFGHWDSLLIICQVLFPEFETQCRNKSMSTTITFNLVRDSSLFQGHMKVLTIIVCDFSLRDGNTMGMNCNIAVKSVEFSHVQRALLLSFRA